MKRVLFICSQNRLRSPTAERVFSNREGFEVASAGLNPEAETPVSSDLLEWRILSSSWSARTGTSCRRSSRRISSRSVLSAWTFRTNSSLWTRFLSAFSRRKQVHSLREADVILNKPLVPITQRHVPLCSRGARAAVAAQRQRYTAGKVCRWLTNI